MRRYIIPIIITASLLLATTGAARAAVYYVDNALGYNCSGNYSLANRACDGTDGNAYTTIQAAVNAATMPGDSVEVRAGSYPERVTTKAAGSGSSGYITIRSYPGETALINHPTNSGFQINHAYIKIDGFEITGGGQAGSAYIFVNRGASNRGDYAYISNNYIHDTTGESTAGIYTYELSSAASGAEHVTITRNRLVRVHYLPLRIYTDYVTITDNLLEGYGNAVARNHNDWDAIYLLGSYCRVAGNEVRNFDGTCSDTCAAPCSAGCSKPHTDFIQTYNESAVNGQSHDNIVEGNYVHDLAGGQETRNNGTQICNLEAQGSSGVRDWIFRNNIFVNIPMKANVKIPGTKWHNNLFYKNNYSGMQHVLQFDSAAASGAEVKNNIFIENAGSSNTAGWYWQWEGTPILVADYNYVAKGPSDAYVPKTGFVTGATEPHGIGGGDPHLADINGTTALGFRLTPQSTLLIDQGTIIPDFSSDFSGVTRPQGPDWDIGAYEYIPAHYIRASAPAGGDGTMWDKALQCLPDMLERGHTYYIADGNYAGYTFDDPNSGAEVITVKKATIAEHGTDTGWQDAYGTGQAVFGPLVFSADNYVLDGVTGGGPGNWESGFGFKVATNGALKNVIFEGPRENITLRHVDFENNGRYTHNNNESIIYSNPSPPGRIRNITVSNCYLHDVETCQLVTRGSDGIVIEYSKLARNGPYNDGHHKEAWSGTDEDNVIVRYNIFEDISNSAVLALVNGSGDAENWQIYGNVFLDSGRFNDVSLGAIVDAKYQPAQNTYIRAVNWKFYNNLVLNIRGLGAGILIENGSGNEAYNNIWLNTRVNTIQFTNITHDYNWFFGNLRVDREPPINLDTGLVNSEPHGQLGTVDPLVNWQGNDFRLKEPTFPGYALPSPFNADAFGNRRGEDGIFDRGAYEYVSATTLGDLSGDGAITAYDAGLALQLGKTELEAGQIAERAVGLQ